MHLYILFLIFLILFISLINLSIYYIYIHRVKRFFAAHDKDQDGKLDCTDVVNMLQANTNIYDNISINVLLLVKQLDKRDKHRIELGLDAVELVNAAADL